MAYVPGMPTNLPTEAKEKAQESYNKQQEKKNSGGTNTSNSSSTTTTTSTNISAPGIGSAGVPTNVQQNAQNQYDSQHSSSSYDTTKTTVPGMPSNIPSNVQQSAQQQYNQQQQSIVDYIESVPVSNFYPNPASINASKILTATSAAEVYNQSREALKTYVATDNTHVYAFHEAQKPKSTQDIIDALPTEVREKIKKNAEHNKLNDLTLKGKSQLAAKVLQYCRAEAEKAEQIPEFDELLSAAHFQGEKQMITVRHANSADYVTLQTSTYRTVFVEDGNENLQDKKGIYTIGRENLAGLPDDVKTVMVDKNNNWLYFVDTGKRANFVEQQTAKQEALTGAYNIKFNDAFSKMNNVQNKIAIMDNAVAYLSDKADKSRKPEDYAALQNAIEKRNAAAEAYGIYSKETTALAESYAQSYVKYQNNITNTKGWTVEDELNYQQLQHYLGFEVNQDQRTIYAGMPSYVVEKINTKSNEDLTTYLAATAAFKELSARREQYGDIPVYLSQEAISKLNGDVNSMQKYVDEYNKWASCTIDAEKGQQLGSAIKGLMYNAFQRHAVQHELLQARLTGDDADLQQWQAIEEQVNYGSSRAINTMGESIYKASGIPLRGVVTSEVTKDLTALRNGTINTKQFTDQLLYNANQFKNITLNNVFANLDVFDLASIERQYTAWKMARNPELYADDAKFQKLQAAYKHMYGTDYRGKVDAMRMAWVSLATSSYQYDDYIYTDASDLRHSNGDKYGLIESMFVGMATDLGVLFSAASKVGEVTLKAVTSNALSDVITDAFVQAITDTGIAKDIAMDFVRSKQVQDEIWGASYRAMSKTFKQGGDEIADNIIKAQRRVISEQLAVNTDEVFEAVRIAKNVDFEKNAIKALNDIAPDIASKTLKLSEAKVVTSALASASDFIDDVQKKLFYAACPVVGIVKGAVKAGEFVSTVSKIISDPKLREVLEVNYAHTANQVQAAISNFDIDTIARRAELDDMINKIDGEFYSTFLETKKTHKTTIVDQVFRNAHGIAQEFTAKSCVGKVVTELSETLKTKGLDGLAEVAINNGYKSFDEYFDIVKTNSLEVFGKYSDKVPVLIDSFESTYKHAIAYDKVSQVSTHISIGKEHISEIRSVFLNNRKKLNPLYSLIDTNPEALQSAGIAVQDSIQNFMLTVNPDWATTVLEDGVERSLYISASDAIDRLSDVIFEPTVNNFAAAQVAVRDYVEDLRTIYQPNANAAYADLMYKVTGVSNYREHMIQFSLNPNAYRKEALDNITDSLTKAIRDTGYCGDVSEALKDVIIDANAIDKQALNQLNTVYRVCFDKGSNMISQIYDKDYIKMADMLCDSNSVINKQLYMYRSDLASRIPDELPDASVASEYLIKLNYMQRQIELIDSAINNANATKSTREFITSLDAKGLSKEVGQGIIDSWCGNYKRINSLIQSYPDDEAAIKIADMLVTDTQNQLALHHGKFESFHNFKIDAGTTVHPNSVDVATNATAIDQILTAKGYEPSPEYRDICISTSRTTNGGAPKDIGFYVRGSEPGTKATVFRKNIAFDVRDDKFAGRVFGCNAESACNAYKAIDQSEALSISEWRQQVHDFIKEQQELALQDNKKIRFIGFNSSDAVSGDHKFLNDTLQECGISIDTASTIDFADELRKQLGEFIIDSDDVAKLRMSISDAIRTARVNSILLDTAPVLSYDTKTTFIDMLKEAAKYEDETVRSIHGVTMYKDMWKNINDGMETLQGNLAKSNYEVAGDALGIYINSQKLSDNISNLIGADVRFNDAIMQAVSNAIKDPSMSLTMHTIFDKTYVSRWFKTDFLTIPSKKKLKIQDIEFADGAYAQSVQDAAKRLYTIYGDAKRLDLITDADLKPLQDTYKMLLEHASVRSIKAAPQSALNIARIIDVSKLNAQELYCVNCWLIERLTEINKFKDPTFIQELSYMLLDVNQRTGTALSEAGRKHILHNVIDYTDPLIDPKAVKYLDDSEDAFRYALQLEDAKKTNAMFNNLKDYQAFQEMLYIKNGSYGTVDNVYFMQSAAMNKPLVELQERFNNFFDDFEANALDNYVNNLHYDEGISKELAARDAHAALIEQKHIEGQTLRNNSVKAVMPLSEEEFKAHLIRNCGGGMVIEPAASCMKGINLPDLLNKWKFYGAKVEEFTLVKDGHNRDLIRVYLPGLGKTDPDELFKKYNHVNIKFGNESTAPFNGGLRHCSFDASDMTLMNGNHMENFKQIFFDGSDDIIDLNGRFNSWSNELYACNMWTEADLKRMVNPFYTDDYVRSLAQNTHQMRHNATALHDLGTLMDNPYMKSRDILEQCHVYDATKSVEENVRNITQQLNDQGYKLCTVVADNNKFKILDFTDELKKLDKTGVALEDLLQNTILVDDGMIDVLSDWATSTNVAVKFAQSGDMSRMFAHAYKLYISTIRSSNIVHYLFANLGTAVRNIVDSTTKAANEIFQEDRSITDFFNNYYNAVSDSHWYANTYKYIEGKYEVVNRETIRNWFAENGGDINKFNIMYGFENTIGGGSLVEYSLKETREKSIKYITDTMGVGAGNAEEIRKIIDSVYASPKYRVLNNAEIAEHLSEIRDVCMRKIEKQFKDLEHIVDMDLIRKNFFGYTPTVTSWGDTVVRYNPVMQLNKKIFTEAETRARLSLFETFVHSGDSEAAAMKHVTATQFDYTGMRKTELFMPFTQYKLYNALYWFDHADVNAIKTAWRYAQYNDDGAWTSEEIADMCSKYQQRQYYLYDRKADAEYDAWINDNVSWVTHTLSDGIDSYLGLPRNLQAGSLELNGTHYIKLGNSFVEEMDLVISAGVGAYMIGANMRNISDAKGWEKLRAGYDALKCTPLYDSLYSPWKSYLDFIVYVYDREHMSDSTKWAHYNGTPSQVYNTINPKTLSKYFQEYFANKSTHSLAVQGIPLVGALIANVVGRVKAGKLNLGELQAVWASPYVQQTTWSYLSEILCDITGAISPSVIGTQITKPQDTYNYYKERFSKILMKDPTNYVDYLGRLEKLGFQEDVAKSIMQTFGDINLSYYNRTQRITLAQDLLSRGYTLTEVSNLLRQVNIDVTESKQFLAMWQALPGFLKYDSTLRAQSLSYYEALGMSKTAAWAMLVTHPGIVTTGGKFITMSANDVALYNKLQQDTYKATQPKTYMTDAEWDKYWDAYNATLRSKGYYYPKGEQRRIREYLKSAGYTFEEAQKMILNGIALDKDGKLVDVQTLQRTRTYSYSTLKGAEWDAYWATVPDYTKYEKGAHSRTMKALKGMGYDDTTARALIQQGVYVAKDGTMMNVAGLKREYAPRTTLGYPDFNTYYQTIPEYCRYEKGAFKRTYAALKNLGFDYDTCCALIQQGAYLMDMTGAPSIVANALAQPALGLDIKVTDINTLLQKYGNTVITGADGKSYMLVNCSGLQRPRKTFSYSRSGSRGGRRSHAMDRMYRAGGGGSRSGKKKFGKAIKPYKARSYKVPKQYITRAPYVEQNNVSTYKGFTNYRGSTKLSKPYTTQGYVSTYSKQNFLEGSSYGMRKAYKVDMRQYKTGALSTKSAYPTSYRNIAVAYRRNLYKDLYAKYGASRMRMRSNLQGYSNASIVRLRRNEIANRERYAERRDLISKRYSGRAKKKSQ